MFDKVLVANRGEIACRIMRTLRRLGVGAVAVYSDADRHAPHVAMADEAVSLGGGGVGDTYLRQDRLLAAALASGAQAIHPGYGFVSENAEFAERCAAAGIVFVGPTALQMREFGLKHRAREIASRVGVGLLPGTGLLSSLAEAETAALRIGYPIMLKSTAGGGGIGMQLVNAPAELDEAFAAVERLATKNFSQGGLFIEKYIARARHIEVQLFGDGRGHVIALGERDCSTQRRNQKIIEETPAPGLSDAIRDRLLAAAIRLGSAVSYQSAGTVEFVFDVHSEQFYFLEVNTRLQVEHGITEEVTDVDLVEWMLRLAAGEQFVLQTPRRRGAAIEVRIYAEDPQRNFRPSTGLLTQVIFPADIRLETWVAGGTEVTPLYDPLIAKIISRGSDRAEALQRMRKALQETSLYGIETNLGYLRQLLADSLFVGGSMTTRALERWSYTPQSIEVMAAGTQTTVQDYPGRLGYWNVGVPPSGPMDSLSFRLGNLAVGNSSGAAGLEITVSGPTLKFNAASLVCLTGAAMAADVCGRPVEFWRPFAVAAGEVLRIGGLVGAGCRAYLAIRGGIDAPFYLASRSTFTLGKFGGHGGRALVVGDTLHRGTDQAEEPRQIPAHCIPSIGTDWELGVLYGPHGAPDYFTDNDIVQFFLSSWQVHYNSSRTGVRLLGYKPEWARSDGGEAGLHPSNIHDNAYAIGSVDFTGDVPVILGPDGPSLGGFVCPATVVKAELWKLGQLRPNDRLRFVGLDGAQAAAREEEQEALFHVAPVPPVGRHVRLPESPILACLPEAGGRPATVYRRAGDKNLLVEYGPPVLDLELRLRVHALMSWLERARLPGVIELTPGIRSLQVHFESRQLPLDRLLRTLENAEAELADNEGMTIATRRVRLPLSWDDESTQLAIAKYMQSVRPDAPWCPSNIEFIRRVNGLDSVDDVRRIVFDASYLVLGLGDVYLGAPVATPIDPRHRLVTTKYNPARTWTPENAVGIGGAYLCVYGMEGPGGYQFVGRTCQMWNTHRATLEFSKDRPWLLRFFDQIQFYPVSHAELDDFRDDFLHGKVGLSISDDTFSLADHRQFLADNAPSIASGKKRQQAAFEAERRRWEASGQIGFAVDLPEPQVADLNAVPPEQLGIASPVAGSVWRVCVTEGQSVNQGDTLLLVESMKMELPIAAPQDGVIAQIRCAPGRAVAVGQTLLVLKSNSDRGDT